MKMIFELFIKQKTWFNFVSFLTEQTLGGKFQIYYVLCNGFYNNIIMVGGEKNKIVGPNNCAVRTFSWN